MVPILAHGRSCGMQASRLLGGNRVIEVLREHAPDLVVEAPAKYPASGSQSGSSQSPSSASHWASQQTVTRWSSLPEQVFGGGRTANGA